MHKLNSKVDVLQRCSVASLQELCLHGEWVEGGLWVGVGGGKGVCYRVGCQCRIFFCNTLFIISLYYFIQAKGLQGRKDEYK